MSSIYVCFNLKSYTSCTESNDLYEKNYQTIYKPLTKFLYSNPDFSFSLAFSGNQLQFYKKRKKEYISLLKQFVDRKQVELLGNGFYTPALTTIFPSDRNGQIDLMSVELRQTVGKRPRGIEIFGDSWDASLVGSLKSSGIEYALLDSSIIPVSKNKYLPLVMSTMGKSVEIFPYFDEFIPSVDLTPQSFIENIVHIVEKVEKKDVYLQFKPARVLSINLSHEIMAELIENKWFDKLSEFLRNNEECRVKITTPSLYKKLETKRIPVYINGGINHQIAKKICQQTGENETRVKNQLSVFDFLEAYPQAKALYNRMLYMNLLINQYKHDKMRKKAARDKLWQAQNGNALIYFTDDSYTNLSFRRQSYKNLMEAEKILREDNNFKESILCFDYTGNGENEYVCRMQNYFTYITLMSGAIQELEILKNTGNYAANLSRTEAFDGCSDDYERGLFIDHVFSEEQFENYLKGYPSGDGVFSRIEYEEVKFSQNHHEIQLEARALFTPTKQQIYLRKKYIINSNGMNVQYILRNESSKKLSVKLAVESNFAHTNFVSDDISYYNLEAVDNEERIVIDTKKSSNELNKQGKLNNIAVVRLTDLEGGVSFAFETNENSGLCYNPILFKRPGSDDKLIPAGLTFETTLFWNIEVEPGMETEKNINFSITSVKKEKKNSKL